ncbi:hypothetical protein HK098_000483 [Nowakowskiella sp. JEL0407]|nr:hypothetical protein HK098_000483 [Nowakowskiella sp. JEL0407]
MAVEDNYNYVCFNGISKRLRFWHLGLFFSDLSTVFGMTFLTLGYCLVYFNQDDACLYTSTIGNIPKEYFIAGLTFIAVGKLRVIFVLIYGGRLKHLESLPKCVAKIQSLPPEITLTRHYFISSAIDEFNLTPLISSSEDTSHFDVNEIDPSKFGLIILGTTASVEFDDRSLLDELKAQYFRTSPPRCDVRVHYKIQGYSAGEILCHSGARKSWYFYRKFYLFVTIIGLGYVYEMWLEWITKEVDLDFKKLVTLQNGKPYDLIRSKKTYNEIME